MTAITTFSSLGDGTAQFQKNGISYTEQEFDYAVSKGIPVIALIHECPEDLKLRNSEIDMVLREKLERFRNRVGSNTFRVKC
jgi:hypothetical protein